MGEGLNSPFLHTIKTIAAISHPMDDDPQTYDKLMTVGDGLSMADHKMSKTMKGIVKTTK